ncbi:MAG TPA: carboxypeptidase regulatory-like domain-containing protein [Saprospiraceae bacterium]|nr:carboxypeptidase regulatory-like domain-containing protein [Saprospiraceae bacterium]HMP22877.1 carboxypeptidase regulatory-like domain-containing protein [Saprospiraceae bacterium]
MKNFAANLLQGKLATALLLCAGMFLASGTLYAQVTTSSMAGIIVDENKEPLIGATIIAVHTPSGTRYGTVTNEVGRYIIPAMRIGGPYTVTVSYVGYDEKTRDNVFLSLGVTANVDVALQSTSFELAGVEVIANRNDVFSSDRTGAATSITSQQLNSFPTLNRRLSDFTRLTPQAGGGNSFAGQDSRLNNITIDGSLFNNSFGLGNEPGARAGTAPISLDAIEEVQVNIAPFDVRQAGFVGAGINAVTRSGTNELTGSAFYNVRNENLTGNKAGEGTYDRALTPFTNSQFGFRLGGPIVKNKLFFFVNAELERNERPYLERANTGNEQVGGGVSRVLASDLDRVSAFLRDNFGYETGPYQGYNLNLKGDKILAKLDWNINNNHKASIRYNRLDAENDILISNSGSLGFGSRQGNGLGMSYQNSNYIQLEKINSVIGELNSIFNNKISNNLIIGFTSQNENRGTRGSFFPLIEIQQGGQNYISTGFEPFTPANQLEYNTYQFINNTSIYLNKHTITAGLSVERLTFKNVFFPGSQGVFVYNNIDDFFTDLNGFKDNPNRTVSPVELRRFQYRYANGSLDLPVNPTLGVREPEQPTKVWYAGIYLQDEWTASDKFKLTAGLRMDIPIFDDTGFENPTVAGQTFLDGRRVSTSKLPDPRPLWSPRLGFNYDAMGDKSLQIRGGTGIFTGRPAFVWISNQIGNNGILTGFEQIDNTNTRPFTPTPIQFIENPNATPSSYELALTDENFKFPQVWRSNIAVDKKLPWNMVATVEFIYNQDVNGISYLNINQEEPTATFAGPDNRPRYAASGLSGAAANNAIRINDNVVNAIFLTNQNEGRSYNIAVTLEKQFTQGLFARFAYAFGEARNLVDPGSIAAGSWNSIASVNGNNRPDLAFSNNDLRHRVLGAISYRAEYFNFGATGISLFVNGAPQGRFSYVYNQDMNGDIVNGNDLMYVPNNASEIRFLDIVSGGNVLFTADQQRAAYEAYINQDAYLSTRRGQYAERNGAIFPWLWNVDLGITQDFFINVGGKRNAFQFRADILNFTNMLNKDWGVGNQVINTRPLTFAGVTPDGEPQFRMVTTGSGANTRLLDSTFQPRFDTQNFTTFWRAQLGIRYIFN